MLVFLTHTVMWLLPLAAAIYFLWLFLTAMRDEPPLIETHWGGFGGGLGGWRVSASLTYLILALAMSGVFTAIALKIVEPGWLDAPTGAAEPKNRTAPSASPGAEPEEKQGEGS